MKLNKKILSLLMCGIITISVVGCNNTNDTIEEKEVSVTQNVSLEDIEIYLESEGFDGVWIENDKIFIERSIYDYMDDFDLTRFRIDYMLNGEEYAEKSIKDVIKKISKEDEEIEKEIKDKFNFDVDIYSNLILDYKSREGYKPMGSEGFLDINNGEITDRNYKWLLGEMERDAQLSKDHEIVYGTWCIIEDLIIETMINEKTIEEKNELLQDLYRAIDNYKNETQNEGTKEVIDILKVLINKIIEKDDLSHGNFVQVSMLRLKGYLSDFIEDTFYGDTKESIKEEVENFKLR